MHGVVVAEDDPLTMMAIADGLTEEGFDVFEARHAVEALAILYRNADNVPVLFTDVRMPGPIDGVSLSRYVKTRWPWIGLLITSAYPVPLHNELPENCRFLRKPYHRGHVVDHIRALAIAA